MTEDFIQANRYKFLTIGAIGTFMGTLDGSILNVALPSIARDLGCGIDTVAWVVLAYSLTLVSLLMVFGAWTKRKGYAFAYKFGYTLFFLGSLICVLSWTVEMLTFGRVVQATGAAVFQSIGIGMVTTVFPHGERGKGIGLMTMMVSAGLMTGPPLGGFMLEIWPWQSIFVINLPIGLLGLSLCFRYFKKFPSPVIDRELKLKGAFVLSIGLLTAMIGLTFLNDYPLTDVRILGPWAISIIALGAFVRLESKPHSAVIGRDLLRNRQFTLGITVMLLMFTALSGTLIMIPFYLQDVKNLPPRVIGFFLILLPVLMFMCAPMAGRLSDRIGYRLLTSGGMLVFALGLYSLADLGRTTDNAYIIGSLALVGVGVGVFSTPNSSALMGSVLEKQRAITSGILSTTRNIGIGLGVALSTAFFSFFRDSYTGSGDEVDAFMYGFHKIIWLPIILALAGSLLCLTRRNRIAKQPNKSVDTCRSIG